MIFVSINDTNLLKFKENHTELNLKLFEETVHPCNAKKKAQELNESETNYILYDTVIMDYIDSDKLFYVNNNGESILFRDKFKEKLKYMYTGEIMLNSDIE